MIDGGFIYIAQPPLYKIKKGKEVFYCYDEEEKLKITGVQEENLDDMIARAEADGAGDQEEEEDVEETVAAKRAPKMHIQRYKGLGEMNAEELWETTMDPARRVLRQVAIEDGAEADRIFDMLMGNDVAPRKSFIQTHAKMADIDI